MLTFVSIPTLVIYGQVKSAGYIVGPGPDTLAVTGGILEMIVALTGIGTAVVLYAILKKQNEILALGFVAIRTLEAASIFMGVACILTIVSLRQTGAGASAVPAAYALATLYDHIFLVSQSFLPAINDILLGVLLYQSRLVPRALSLVGIFGGPLLIVGFLAVMFGFVGQHDALAGLSAIGVAVFEFALGLWLIFKGFNPSAITRLQGKT